MIKAQWRGVNKLYKSLIRIEKRVDETSFEFLVYVAEWLRNDIRWRWSSSSPSSIGSPPAILTGNLDSSIKVARQGRTSGGQFASTSDAKKLFIVIDTEAGDNPLGRGQYSGVLELDRPFMQPAVRRLEGVYSSLAKRKIKTK